MSWAKEKSERQDLLLSPSFSPILFSYLITERICFFGLNLTNNVRQHSSSIPWQTISQSGWVKKSQQKALNIVYLKSPFLPSQSSKFCPPMTSSNGSSLWALSCFLLPDKLFLFLKSVVVLYLSILEMPHNIYLPFLFPIFNLRVVKLEICLMFSETPAASRLLLWKYYITHKCLLKARTTNLKCYNSFLTLVFGKKSLRYLLIGMQM